MTVTLKQSKKGELLDEPMNSSATVISTSSFAAIQKGFPQLSIDDLRLRFRANIEITGVEAFWEEQLLGLRGESKRFRIGDIHLLATGPRARCNVPPRNPETGIPVSGFAKDFVNFRRSNLRNNSMLSEYGHLYYLTVDTLIDLNQIGKTIYKRDPVETF